MREAIGGTWIFSIVITFIVLFASFLAVSVNYSKVFKIKDGVINIIEHNEGLTNSARDEINVYLQNSGYYVYGTCAPGEQGELPNKTNTKYKYCVSTKVSGEGTLTRTYYKVSVFFKIDLPVIGSILTFPVSGETKGIYFAY